jgi:hypothetical protein
MDKNNKHEVKDIVTSPDHSRDTAYMCSTCQITSLRHGAGEPSISEGSRECKGIEMFIKPGAVPRKLSMTNAMVGTLPIWIIASIF